MEKDQDGLATQVTNATDSIRHRIHRNRKIIQSLKAKADAKRTITEKLADWITGVFGSITFLFINAAAFALWIVYNTGLVPGFSPFDPFPFNFLTMTVSLEAIMLAIFVLISQNRSARIADLRSEIDLHIDIIAEQEVTKMMTLVTVLLKKQGFDIAQDQELVEMLKPTDTEKITKILESQV